MSRCSKCELELDLADRDMPPGWCSRCWSHHALFEIPKEPSTHLALLARAGVPERYAEMSRASWEQRWKPWTESKLVDRAGRTWSLAELCDTWISQKDPGRDWLLLFMGAHGRRKTGLATAMLGEAIMAGERDCGWLDCDLWMTELEAAIGSNETAAVLRLAGVRRLVLDDLGAVRGSGKPSWSAQRLVTAIRKRESERRPTIVTTNAASLEDFAALNHSLPSRFGVQLAFTIGGKDFRREGSV